MASDEASEERVAALHLGLALGSGLRSGREGEQGLGEVGGEVSQSGGRLSERGGEDRQLVGEGEGQ